MQRRKLTLGILDDHDILRNGLKSLVLQTNNFELVFSSAREQELYKFLRSSEMNVLLLDIKLGNQTGISVLKHIKEHHSSTSVIMLTTHDEPSYVSHCISNGANGYVLKSTPFPQLVELILKIYEKGTFFEEAIANLFIADSQQLNKLEADGVPISSYERKLIQLLAEGNTASEIAKKVFKGDRTIEKHRSDLLKKTNCKNVNQLISWAYKNKVL